MKSVLHFYDIYPKITEAGKASLITIESLDRHCHFQEGAGYQITIIPMNHISGEYTTSCCPSVSSAAADHKLTFSFHFHEEQEYNILVSRKEEVLCKLSVYALNKDLYGLMPYKGNIHMHTFFSDGVESPELVAANYRSAGYDFIAITDHGQYPPSLEAAHIYQGLDLEFQIYPGEEIHAPRNKIHILNFAGTKSVNQFCRDYPEQYEAEVNEILKELNLSDSQEDFEYASSIWVFRKIREYEGMSVLAHPNWVLSWAYNIPPGQYMKFLREKPFDVLELINGGDTPDENTHQTAIWHDICSLSHSVPVIGTDDSHGTVNGKWFDIGFTYVLAGSNSKQDLIHGMKNQMCVAVECYRGESPRFYGNYRMVSLFNFLHREYFPIHDELCRPEGHFMLRYLQKEKSAEDILLMLKGQITALQKKYICPSLRCSQ